MICSTSLIEDSDQPVVIGRDDSGGEVLQKRLIVDFCVLDFGKKLRVLDRDRELSAKDEERALLDVAVNTARAARAQEHDAGELFAGENSHRDGELQRIHLSFHAFQLDGGRHTMEFVHDDRFLSPFKMGNDGLITMEFHPRSSANPPAPRGIAARKIPAPEGEGRLFRCRPPARSLGRSVRADQPSVVTERRIAVA